MIDLNNAVRVEKWIIEAHMTGGKIICGGKRNSSYVEPTIITRTDTTMRVNSEEVFGPVVVIEKFKTIEEAIAMINDSRFGLQCGVFTNEISEMNYCFNHIDVGGVLINDVPSLRFDHMPYGGVKDSGLGREGVKYAIKDMMESKILVR
jgi:acyl-CoA reductase-like NAD-dependent aldehyde dehydrogenase